MKKRVLILAAIALLLCISAALWYYRPIGTVEGPEWDILHIDDETYVSRKSSGVDFPYNGSDRGRHIGIIKSGKYIFHIYEIKGDSAHDYLYWRWEWEGEMFIREDLLESVE